MKDGLIIDLFAGGGGASVGIEMALGREVDIAINHDPQAILMHKTNHPNTLHLTEDVFKVDLKKIVGDRHVALMWASPDCTSHSKAKGGQPRSKGLRILPWAVFKHARLIKPDVIVMENVEEIQQWGPLDENGHPIKARLGESYNQFMNAMKSLGYKVESRELIAADYGAPTTRKRWYAIFRRDGEPIVWPVQTHFENGTPKWLECGDYIDWSDLGKSIFGRKKPLAEATQRRIANGIKKYIIDNPNPYIVKDKAAIAYMIQYHGEQKAGDSRGQRLDEPIKTIDTSNRYGLVTAFITKFYKTGIGQGCGEPLHTITTSQGHFGVVSVELERIADEQGNNSYIRTDEGRNNNSSTGRNILEECKCDKSRKDYSNCSQKNGSGAEERIPGRCGLEGWQTIPSDGTQGGVSASRGGITTTHGHKSQGRKQTQQQSVKPRSCNTECESQARLQNRSEEENGLCERILDKSKGTETQGDVIFRDREGSWYFSDSCIPCKQTLISSWLIKYYGTGCGQTLDMPLATVTTKDRFGLVNVVLDIKGEQYIITDILLRMLKPEELKVMQGFPKDYIIDRDYDWNRYPKAEQVARIGNSVVPMVARSIIEANCGKLKVGERSPNPIVYEDGYGQVAFA